MNAKAVNYLNWLSERGITYPQLREIPLPKSAPADSLAFAVRHRGHPSFSWRKLLDKMLLSINSSHAPVLGAKEDLVKYRRVVALGQEAANDLGISNIEMGTWCEHRGQKVLVTYHPSELIVSPDLKRQSWLHLQKIGAPDA